MTATTGRAETIARICELLVSLGVDPGRDPLQAANALLAMHERERAGILDAARAEADALRRDAIVTADGIRQIALEDAKDLQRRRPATDDALPGRVQDLERKVAKQRRRIKRLERALFGLAPRR